MSRQVRGVLVLAGTAVLVGCGSHGAATPTGGPATTAAATGTAIAERGRPGATADESKAGRSLLRASDWPDACALSDSVPGWTLTNPQADKGSRTGGKDRGPSRECRRTLEPAATVELKVLSVTNDVQDVWSAYRFTAGAYRDVKHLGDEAFLTSGGVDDDVLYVCKGRTIFTLRATGVTPQAQLHRLLLAVGSAAVSRLAGSAAGAPAT